MRADWIYASWKESLEDNVLATNIMFDRYKVPIFHELCVISSGFDDKSKAFIKEALDKDGGSYVDVFNENIDVVIVNKGIKMETDTICAARNARKPCVTIEWIQHSQNKGYAVAFEDFFLSTMWLR